MSPIFLYNGGILLRNGMIAANANCCCSSSSSSSSVIGCGCEQSIGAICSSISISIANFWNGAGAQINLPNDIHNFEGGNTNYVINDMNCSFNVSTSLNCQLNTGSSPEANDDTLLITLGVVITPLCDLWCEQPPGNVTPVGATTFEIQFDPGPCDETGFADISGNYNLLILGNAPCGGVPGGGNMSVTWGVSQAPCA